MEQRVKEILNTYAMKASNTYRLFQKLLLLELENKKDTEEYDKEYEHYKIALSFEKDFLDTLTVEECCECIKCIRANLKEDNDIAIRIVYQIMYRLAMDMRHDSVIIDERYNEFFVDYFKVDKSQKDEMFFVKRCYALIKAISRDLNMLAMSLLEKYKTNKAEIQDIIKSMIYNYGYFHPELEADLVVQKFNIPSDVNLTSPLFMKIYELNDEIYNSLQDLVSREMAMDAINTIIATGDYKLSEDESLAKVIWAQCQLSASLILMSEDVKIRFQEVVGNIRETLNKISEEDSLVSTKVCQSIINGCFENYKKDKEHIRILSFIS